MLTESGHGQTGQDRNKTDGDPAEKPRGASAAQGQYERKQQQERRKRGLLDLGFIEDRWPVESVQQRRAVAG